MVFCLVLRVWQGLLGGVLGSYDIDGMVPDNTVHLSQNRPPLVTQGRLTFYFDIATYTSTPFAKLFYIFYSTVVSADWDTPGL